MEFMATAASVRLVLFCAGARPQNARASRPQRNRVVGCGGECESPLDCVDCVRLLCSRQKSGVADLDYPAGTIHLIILSYNYEYCSIEYWFTNVHCCNLEKRNETKDRSQVPLRNYFTPGARPAPATAAASRSQASSPALPRSLRRSTSRLPPGHCGSAGDCRCDGSSNPCGRYS